MSGIEDLYRARREVETALVFIAKPTRWAQGVDAFDDNRLRISTNSPNARAWCLIGAIARAIDAESAADVIELHPKSLEALENALPLSARYRNLDNVHPVAAFQDSHSHADAMRLGAGALEQIDEEIAEFWQGRR